MMKYLKIFEEYDENLSNDLLLKVKAYLKKSSFKNLPFDYQKTVVIRHFETDGQFDNNTDYDENLLKYVEKNHKNDKKWTKNDKFLSKLVENYTRFREDKTFLYGKLPMKILTDLVMSSKELSDHDDFDTYHNWYGKNDLSDNDVYPILMIEDDSLSYIEDGWHRFHRYYDQGVTEIPVVMFSIILFTFFIT